MSMKRFLLLVTPPIIIVLARRIKKSFSSKTKKKILRPEDSSKQELDIYWTNEMAEQLEYWGRDHAWNEIECLLVGCPPGKVLDIACGTGVNILALKKFSFLEIYGFDISDFLIKKAISKGISSDRLKVNDATNTDYQDNEFDYSYSIGSLEHFTESGIDLFLKECSRYTKKISFHMLPVSESNK